MDHLLIPLHRLLKDHGGTAPEVARAIGVLKPLYESLEFGEYRLFPLRMLDPSQVRAAITAATGVPAKKAALLTIGQVSAIPAPDMRWARLGELLRDRHFVPLIGTLPERIRRDLEGHMNVFDARIEDAVWDTAWEALPDDLVQKPWLDVLFGLRMTVWSFIASGLARDGERVAHLAPLVRLVTHAVPIGERTAEPGAWAVLCRRD